MSNLNTHEQLHADRYMYAIRLTDVNIQLSIYVPVLHISASLFLRGTYIRAPFCFPISTNTRLTSLPGRTLRRTLLPLLSRSFWSTSNLYQNVFDKCAKRGGVCSLSNASEGYLIFTYNFVVRVWPRGIAPRRI
jgi:hypothetical protein